MDFYGEVLLELTTALGAALFVANGYALLRRRADARAGSPVRKQVRVATTGNLAQAPMARTVVFMVVGLAVAIAGLASLTH